jgi:hypothetical protein
MIYIFLEEDVFLLLFVPFHSWLKLNFLILINAIKERHTSLEIAPFPSCSSAAFVVVVDNVVVVVVVHLLRLPSRGPGCMVLRVLLVRHELGHEVAARLALRLLWRRLLLALLRLLLLRRGRLVLAIKVGGHASAEEDLHAAVGAQRNMHRAVARDVVVGHGPLRVEAVLRPHQALLRRRDARARLDHPADCRNIVVRAHLHRNRLTRHRPHKDPESPMLLLVLLLQLQRGRQRSQIQHDAGGQESRECAREKREGKGRFSFLSTSHSTNPQSAKNGRTCAKIFRFRFGNKVCFFSRWFCGVVFVCVGGSSVIRSHASCRSSPISPLFLSPLMATLTEAQRRRNRRAAQRHRAMQRTSVPTDLGLNERTELLCHAINAGAAGTVRSFLTASPGAFDLFTRVEALDGATVLGLAAMRGNQEALIMLLDQGADGNRRDTHEYTPLMHACLHGHTACARTLMLTPTVNPDLALPDGRTALMLAAERGHVSIVHELVALGARVKKNKR